MKNVIYAYKKVDENKIVYIGQTVNLPLRHYRHTKIDPFDEGLKEYNYPLSRGIRKYGVQAYELLILEEGIEKEDLDKREQYWIQYYDTYNNGYNQTLGGNTQLMPTIKYDETVIFKVIEDLKNTTKSFQTIADENQISLTHVYNINIGARRKIKGIKYPIRDSKTKGTRGLRFSIILKKHLNQ
jgi:group I intron endonuclease